MTCPTSGSPEKANGIGTACTSAGSTGADGADEDAAVLFGDDEAGDEFGGSAGGAAGGDVDEAAGVEPGLGADADLKVAAVGDHDGDFGGEFEIVEGDGAELAVSEPRGAGDEDFVESLGGDRDAGGDGGVGDVGEAVAGIEEVAALEDGAGGGGHVAVDGDLVEPECAG